MAKQLKLERLTPAGFAPFGTVIENPSISPDITPRELIPKSVEANQGSATKFLNVTVPVNLYGGATSGVPSDAKFNMFSCKPRKLKATLDAHDKAQEDISSPYVSLRRAGLAGTRATSHKEFFFPVEILERHPFTYQTFIPLGLAANDDTTAYLIIVARTSMGEASNNIQNPPDLSTARAFLAHGRQAVTYAAGTWHAPMVVVGRDTIDFVVCQWSNGVANEDCEEFPIAAEQRPAVVLNLEVDSNALYEFAWDPGNSSKL